MKTHMKTHSYKVIQFKCNKCDFLGPWEIDIAVHVGREHGDCFECGLCEHIAEDLESLDTHLFTCEIYKCNTCEQVFKNLGDVKSHLLKEHDGTISHIKQSREIEHEYSTRSYRYKELFSEEGN